jgi:Predicted metal-dependent membrane protease
MLLIDIVLLVTVMLLTGILYPVMGYRQSKKRGTIIGGNDKTGWYLTSIISSWIPAIVIVAALILNGHSFKDIGFNFNLPDERGYLFYIALALSAIYLGYNIFTILLLRFNNKERERHSKEIPVEYRFILPSSKDEKVMWRLLAATAGITEEIIYRGYIFFALFFIFPGISFVWVILISSALFSLGHLYQGREVWKPAAAGVFLASVYFFTGTIYIVIILHIVQDLVAGELDPAIRDTSTTPLRPDIEIIESSSGNLSSNEIIDEITPFSNEFESRTDQIEGVD